MACTNDLFGSTVNLCAKINRMAKPDGMVIGGDFYRIVSTFDEYHFTEVVYLQDRQKIPISSLLFNVLIIGQP
jgi:class 3 adenylate cyclase